MHNLQFWENQEKKKGTKQQEYSFTSLHKAITCLATGSHVANKKRGKKYYNHEFPTYQAGIPKGCNKEEITYTV